MPFIPLEASQPERTGFIPLEGGSADDQRGFVPLEDGGPSFSERIAPAVKTVRAVGAVYPVAETAANFGSQMIALPVAGVAGLGTMATNAMGLTDEDPADVVHAVGDVLTYQPKTDLGQHLTMAASYPFELLAKGGEYAGDKTLEATGSPVAAAAVDTAIQLAPFAVAPAAKGVKALRERGKASADIPREGIDHGPGAERDSASSGVPGVDRYENTVQQPESPGFHPLREARDHGMPGVADELRDLPPGRGEAPIEGIDSGATGHERGLLPGERSLALDRGAEPEAPRDLSPPVQREGIDGSPDRTGTGVASILDQGTPEVPFAGESRLPGELPAEALPDVQGNQDALGGRGALDRDKAGRVEGPPPTPDAIGKGIDPGSIAPEQQGFIPLRDTIDAAAHEAAASPLNDLSHPTAAQIEAGNYKKGNIQLHGLDIAIENPKGSIRSGVSPEGKPWQTEMQHHYGYVKRSLGKDGDPVDVFIGPKPESQKAFIIDQIDPKSGRFDEHKAVIGADTLGEAKAIYQANHEPGWRGAGAITEMPVPEFKDWVLNGNTKVPLAIPKLLGQRVTEYTDAQLAKLQSSKMLSDAGRERVSTEIERRSTDVQAMAAPDVQNSWAPGANYVPLIDDARAPMTAAESRAKPITREEVLTPFMKALNLPIYEGRVKGKRMGYYMPKLETLRIKRKSDLEVAAHEIAHAIDDRVPEIGSIWKANPAIKDELRGVSYDHNNVKEGFAEFMRLYLTQPELAAEKSPQFNAWMDKFVQRHEYGPAILQAREGMTSWFGQAAIDRARSKIGATQPINEALNGIWDRFRQSTVDDLHGIYRMERDLKGNKIAAAGAYETTRLTRASHSITDGAVRFGYPVKKPDGSFKFEGKGLEEILKPVSENLEDTLLYFVGKSANELMSQKREHLFTRGEIDAMQRLRTPARDKAFAEYQKWNAGVVDFAESQGVVNPQARMMWQRQSYMPFHRVGQPGEFKGGKPGNWSGIQVLTGGTDNLKDILGNMVQNAATLIDKAVKNEARMKIVQLATKERGGGRFLQEIPKESRPVKISPELIMDAILKAMGVDQHGSISPQMKKLIARLKEQVGNAPEAFEFMLQDKAPSGRNIVAVLEGGKPRYFEVADPLLMRALSSIDRTNQHWLIKWLGWPKRVGQMSITLTPDFMVANIARDTLMGSIMSRHGFKPVMDSLEGMRLRLTKDPVYKDFIANGGGLSSIYLDEAAFRAKLEKFYTRHGIDYRTVLDAPDKLLGFIETLGDAFESSTRLGEYKRAVKAGENPRHAAYLGRDVSTDFAMRGDSQALGMMYDTVMFLKPAVLSIDRLARGLAHDPNRGAIATKAGLIALASMALYMLNRNDPRYADLPDWDRDTNWHFFIGTEHFRFPKIWEVGAFASAAERTLERTSQEDPEGLAADLVRILGQTFNLNLMPQIVAPLYEQATNRNSFTKAPIETPGMENVQPFLRSKAGTSETMKEAGMATRDLPESSQLNPARAEALLRGYFGTWAMYGLMLTDQALFKNRLPEMRTDQLPVVRRFYSQEPARATKYESMFYDMLGEADRLRGTLKELDRIGRPDIADQKEQSPLAGEAKPLEKANENLRGINKDMNAVRRNQALTPAEKRLKLDSLTVERNALLKAAVTDAQRAQTLKEQARRAEAKLKEGRQ